MKMTKRIAAMAACTVMTLSTAMSVTVSAMDTTEQFTSISESANAPLTIIKSISGYSNYAVQQEGDGSCWAACILSVLKYHDYRTTETFEDIYRQANRLTGSNMSVGDAIATSKLPVIISHYLGMSKITSSYGYYYEQIYSHLVADEPLIGIINNGNNTYHAVVIYGFEGSEFNGEHYTTYLRIMNPSTGTCSKVLYRDFTWAAIYGYSNLV